MADTLESYQCSDVGLLMPFTNEYTWSLGFRIFIYLVGMLWSFMGISIVADVFMAAIEAITSKTRKIQIIDADSDEGLKEVEVLVWNGTVANLTLMALGSSAPEILLNVIGVISKKFTVDSLGPGTIVGSAAFNLMCITGVCIMVIPDGEVRKIRSIKVFAVTAVFSLVAYIWLIIILMVVTPDYVDVWEAIVTFLLFPIMVIVAYIMDRDYFASKKKEEVEDEAQLDLEAILKGETIPDGGLIADKRLVLEFIRKMRHEKKCGEKEFANIVSFVMEKDAPHTRGWYRRNAIRNLTGSAKLEPVLDEKSKELLETMLMTEDMTGSDTSFMTKSEGATKAIIEFDCASAAVLEKDGRVKLRIMRHGNLNKRIIFKVETIDGTAESDSDYIPVKKTMVFEPGKTSETLDIEIIDDNEWEPDEVFFVRLSVDPDQPCVLGKRKICQVVIVNDDDPGTAEFDKPSYLFKESCGKALVPLTRSNGVDGKLSVKWKTKDISAIAGRDYKETSGEVVFAHGETQKHIEIEIIDDLEFEKDENFELILTEVSAGGKLGKLHRTVVTIVNDDDFNGFVSRITDLTNANLDALRVQRATWGQQFVEAMNVNGGDLENAKTFDYIMHFFMFGWKLLFAFIPPPSIWGGWLSFIVALGAIGLLTAIVGDLAGIFGCLIGLEDSVVAITFVALGTSLPDLFASKQAALNEKTADNSIGNVTGSNAVNVFLGLGLPWLIAAIYWTAQGKTFEVPAGNLGFSVVVYTVCAVATIALLLLRRYIPLFGGELGGPKIPKIVCGVGLILLWIFYVLMASFQAYGYIEGF